MTCELPAGPVRQRAEGIFPVGSRLNQEAKVAAAAGDNYRSLVCRGSALAVKPAGTAIPECGRHAVVANIGHPHTLGSDCLHRPMDAEGAVGLGSKGIEKFLAYEIPLALAK
jgi:hypothetical protein